MSEHASVADVVANGGEPAFGDAAMPAESIGMPAPTLSFAAMPHQHAVNQPVRRCFSQSSQRSRNGALLLNGGQKPGR